MADSDFDLEALKNTVIEGVLDTEYPLVPEGDYVGTIRKVDGRQIDMTDGTKRTVININWVVSDDTGVVNLEEITGRPDPVVQQSIFLDIENGVLAMGTGKNVDLGRLRDALGQNSGKPWNLGMLDGQIARVTVKHRKDKKNDRVVAQVTSGVKAL